MSEANESRLRAHRSTPFLTDDLQLTTYNVVVSHWSLVNNYIVIVRSLNDPRAASATRALLRLHPCHRAWADPHF